MPPGRRSLEYPISTAVSSTLFCKVSLMSDAPLRALDTVPLEMPSLSAISCIVTIFPAPLFYVEIDVFIIEESFVEINVILRKNTISFDEFRKERIRHIVKMHKNLERNL